MEDPTKKPKSINPCVNSNILSYGIYRWTSKIFSIGQERPLEYSDCYEPLQEHSSSYLSEKIEKIWHEKIKQGSPNLTLVLLRFFWKQIFINLITILISELFFKTVQPLLLGKLISYYSPEENDMTNTDLYLYTFGFIVCSIMALVLRHPFSFSNGHLGMKVRIACCALIYKKSLKISKTESVNNSTGQIVNLLAKDVSAFDYSTLLLLYLFAAPIQAIIMTIFMYQRMGVSIIIGNLCLLIVIPFQLFLGKVIKNKKQKSMPLTDKRLNFVNEVIAGISVIKMFAWEKPFNKLMKTLRRNEIDKIKYLSWARALVMSFVIFNTRFALFMGIIVYVFLGNTISAENVFVVTCYYNYIKHGLCNIFPIAITNIAELKVAIKRIQSFLLQKELETTSIMLDNPENENDEEDNDDEIIIPFIGNDGVKNFKVRWNPVIDTSDSVENNENDEVADETAGPSNVNNMNVSLRSITTNYALKLDSVYMKWSSNQYEYNLTNISLKIKQGSLVAIIGQVGCGKSSLFHTILKETPISSGELTIDGSLSYASQDPWLFNSSVRRNILFGSEMNHVRYSDVIKCCILNKDIKSFTNGDDTIVGEKGMKISGGQQARINLARAVYRNADIFLFDDPLSAVDCHISQQLFNDCFVEYLKGKTRLLITHQYQHLSKVDHIILLDNGYVIAEGSYESLMENSPAFQNLIKSKEDNLDELYTELKTEENPNETEEYDLTEDLICEEERKEGSVDRWVYTSYMSASGPIILSVIFMIVFLFGQFLASYSDYWITLWVNAEENAYILFKNMTSFVNVTDDFNNDSLSENNLTVTSNNCIEFYYMDERNHYMIVYSGLIILLVFFAIFRVMMFFWLCLKASVKLHNDLFKSVIHATMRFFYTTPTGRILNRFIYDMSMVDEILPKIIYDCIQIFSQVLGIMVVIVFINIWLLIPIMISIGFFIYLRHYYTNVARSLKRLEATARSPVFSHLNASFQGLSTIRAFGVQKILEKEFNEHQDQHSSVWFLNLGTSRAFGLWLDAVCMLFLIIVVLILVISGTETGGNIGLGITQVLGIIGIFQYAIRTLTEVETLMTSVERILEYQDVEQEPPLHMEVDEKLPNDWPLNGKIEFDNVSSRYSPNGRIILKELSFVFQSNEKIGIVGRSGSGKTTIINSIFRMLFTDGSIKIDDININSIGLHKLRDNISVIPQEPILFSGTLRYNLDPFSTCNDDEVWTALERVELKDTVLAMSDGLNTTITGSNSSFSVGQRQLICLARAILCRNCILILDEATANVDPRTDSLIQKTIREEFKNYTVITIAHRLQTIMDSDKVMVMEYGRKIEFDHPYILLQNKEGKFSQMVRTTEDSGENLCEIAKKSYMEKYQQQKFNED